MECIAASHLINEIDQCVATEVVLHIRYMALACMQLFVRRESLEMLPADRSEGCIQLQNIAHKNQSIIMH